MRVGEVTGTASRPDGVTVWLLTVRDLFGLTTAKDYCGQQTLVLYVTYLALGHYCNQRTLVLYLVCLLLPLLGLVLYLVYHVIGSAGFF